MTLRAVVTARFAALLPAAAVLATALLELRGFGLRGTPAFRHDWFWPLTPGGVHDYLVSLTSPVLAANWHQAAWLPRLTPIGAVLAALSTVPVAPEMSIRLLLLGLLVLAAFGARRLALAYGATAGGALLAGCVFALSPFVTDELAAGHLWILAGYAILPWAAASSESEEHWAIQMLWYASLAIDQHQLGFAFVSIALALLRGRRRGVAGAFLGLSAFVPPIFAALRAHAAGDLLGQQVYAFYTTVNSTPLLDGLRGIGYFAGYDRAGLGPLSAAALWLMPVAAVGAAMVARRFEPLALACLGVLLSAGVYGPLAPLVSSALDANGPFSMYRELFVFMEPAWLGYALAVALCSRRAWSVGLLSILCACALWPQLTSQVAELVPLYSPPEQVQALLRRVGDTPGSGMIAPFPVGSPMRAMGAASAGLDPLGISVGTHGVLSSGQVLPAGARALYGRRTIDAALAQAFRVRFAIHRSGWIDDSVALLPAGYRLRPANPRSSPPVGGEEWRLQTFPPSTAVRLGGAILCADGDFSRLPQRRIVVFAGDNRWCGAQAVRIPLATYPYPRDGWVPYAPIWEIAPAAADALAPSVITSGLRPFPSVASCRLGASYRYEGYYLPGAGGVKRFARTVRGCEGAAGIGRGTTVLSSVVEPRAERVVTPVRATVSAERDGGWFLSGTARLRGAGVLELDRAYDPGWTCVLRGAAELRRDVRADGTFTGWLVRGSGRFSFVAFFWPAVLIYAMECGLALLWIFGIARYSMSRVMARD